MRSQKEAERAEQQRIKNLVLNYDLQDSTDVDGKATFSVLITSPDRISIFLSILLLYQLR